MKTRTVVILLVAIVIAVRCAIEGLGRLYQWDSNVNRGYHWGYWGEFNRIRDALSLLPNIVVHASWANEDLTLEEMGFVIEVSSRRIWISLEEDDPIRNLSGERLASELSRLIASEMENANERPTNASTVRRTRCTPAAYAPVAPRVPVRFAAGEA